MWTWVDVDADSKLVPCWYIGRCTTTYAPECMRDLAARLEGPVHFHRWPPVLIVGVARAFGGQVD